MKMKNVFAPMKRIILSILLIGFCKFMWAQTENPISCSNGKATLSATIAGDGLTVFTAFYPDRNTIDTLLIAPFTTSLEVSCSCNDSVATFYCDEVSSALLEIFVCTNGRWKFNDALFLPPEFPLVGVLIDGRTYERYHHRLVSPTEIVSNLVVLTADKRQQIPTEQFDLYYKIVMEPATPNPGMITTYNCHLVLVKKTRRDL